MTTLENLYNGNINPCESEYLKNNSEYKKLIALTAQAQEKIAATLTKEQKKLFYKMFNAPCFQSFLKHGKHFALCFRPFRKRKKHFAPYF